MTQLAKRAAGATLTAPCRDRIEEGIIRAYIRLALAPDHEDGPRTTIVSQFGALEVRMTESPRAESTPMAAPFRVEIYSHEVDAVLGSGDYFEFDEDELKAAVELIFSAQTAQPAQHCLN